jgi:hypothetical protein
VGARTVREGNELFDRPDFDPLRHYLQDHEDTSQDLCESVSFLAGNVADEQHQQRSFVNRED